jgi:hypothetical protein
MCDSTIIWRCLVCLLTFVLEPLCQYLPKLSLSANSLERIHQYYNIEQEPASSGSEPPAAWPTTGEIVVKELEARYWKVMTSTF